MKRTALIFDLDGTLVDSLPDLQAALNETLREIRAAPLSRDELRSMVGDGSPALVGRALASRGMPQEALPERLARFLALYEAEPALHSSLYPGVAETLAALQAEGHRLAICTNKPLAATRAVLRGFALDGVFGAVLGGDAVAEKKPHPGHLLAAIAALGAGPAEAVMIGDGENDIAAARAAGVPSVLVRYGYARLPLAALEADIEIDAFTELPEALRRL